MTEEEIVETITHLAFYAGWPSAVTAVTVAKEVFGKKRPKSLERDRLAWRSRPTRGEAIV